MRSVACLCVLAMFAAAPSVSAQTALQGEAVAPGTQPAGLRAGVQPLTGAPPTAAQAVDTFWQPLNAQPPGHTVNNWTFFPMVTGAAVFDDNVFARTANKLSDWVFIARPELAVTNRGQNHAIEAHAFVEGQEYATFKSENQVNAAASLGGTVMLGKDTQFQGRARFVHAHEERGIGETIVNGTVFPQTLKPIAYNQFDVASALNHRRDRLWVSLGAAATWFHFDDAPLADGTIALQTFRNGVIGAVPVRVGYVVAPNTSIFVQGMPNRRDFSADDFDSDGYHVVGGVLLEPGAGARIRGEAYIGYMGQAYRGMTFQDVSTWTFAASLGILVTDRLTMSLQGRREAKETAVTCVVQNVFVGCGSSLVESWGGARLDYRLLPNLVVGVGATYLVDEINDIVNGPRTDRVLRPLASLRYFPNQWLTFGFDYRHVDYDSNRLGILGYDRNVFVFSAHAKL